MSEDKWTHDERCYEWHWECAMELIHRQKDTLKKKRGLAVTSRDYLRTHNELTGYETAYRDALNDIFDALDGDGDE